MDDQCKTADKQEIGMYQNIAILMCRILALYVFVNFTSALYMAFVAYTSREFEGIFNADKVMYFYVLGQSLHLLLLAVLGLFLWFGALRFSKIIIKPLHLENDIPNANADRICAAIIAATGFIILTFSFQHLGRWLPHITSEDGIRDWHTVYISAAYILMAFLLIITPSGVWNTIKKIRAM